MGKYKLYIIALIIASAGCLSSFGQTLKIDSLVNSINVSKDDSNKVNALIKLGSQYEYFKSKERIEYHISALNLAKKINFTNGIIKSYVNLITNLSHRQLYDVALEYCYSYIDFLNENKNEEELKKNYKLYATLLGRQGKYKESLEYNYKALNYYLSKSDRVQYAVVLSNICLLHLNNNQADSAYLYGIRAVDIFRESNKQSELANSTLGLAEISFSKKDYLNAREKANHALEIYTGINIELGELNTYFVLGNIDYAEAKHDSAIAHYKKSLQLLEKFSLPEIKRDCYLALAKTYYALHKNDEAYKNQVLYTVYSDSVADQKFKAKALEMDVKYSITKKEGELREKELKILSQNKQRNFLILGIVGVLILFIISYRGYQQKKKANHLITEQKKLVEEKQKEILDSIRYAKRIQSSHLPHLEYVNKNLKRLMKNKF